MKKHSHHKYRNRLFISMILIASLPLIICTVLIIELARTQMNRTVKASGTDELTDIVSFFNDKVKQFDSVGVLVEADDELITAVLNGNEEESTAVYQKLFDITAELRSYARFSLYNADAELCYSTGKGDPEKLATNWGILDKATSTKTGIRPMLSEGDSPELKSAVRLEKQGELIGWLVMTVDEAGFNELFGGKYGAGNELLVMNKFYRPVYYTQSSLLDKAPSLRSKLIKTGTLEEVDQNYFYLVRRHGATGICFVLQAPRAFTKDSTKLLYIVSCICAVTAIVLSVLIAAKLSKQMSKPIYELKKAIGEVGQDNFDIALEPVRNDEFGRLTKRFNEMVKALKTNREQLIENQHELNEAQTRMLQAQLNPHFLCNTLDTMKWMGKINNIPEVSLMSTDLAEVLRFAISPDEFVTLDREAEITARYIEIQKVRLSDSFSFCEEISDDVWDCLVPKMILQPLVENAILHGISGMENGKITVAAGRKEDGSLFISVRDNGKGMPEEMTGPYSSHDKEAFRGHLGLHNVDTILRKNYGESFGLVLRNLPDNGGAEVTASLPYNLDV